MGGSGARDVRDTVGLSVGGVPHFMCAILMHCIHFNHSIILDSRVPEIADPDPAFQAQLPHDITGSTGKCR